VVAQEVSVAPARGPAVVADRPAWEAVVAEEASAVVEEVAVAAVVVAAVAAGGNRS
jgi:hypothetical protein